MEKTGSVIEGQIFTYDETTDIVVLQSPAANGQSARGAKHDFHFLKVSALKDVSVISGPGSQSPSSPASASDAGAGLVPIGNLNIDKVVQRENIAVRQERERIARIGVGVTKEAQHIFDALAKTLPCVWNNEQIIILGQVVLLPPYGIENVHPIKGADTSGNTLERIRKVLAGEKRRLGMESTSS